ncbi:MAG: hypothetical protein A2505_09580 [Deltaproteobacteria bacterium RIFOXYD12_FULL_55_16]|nr:MAG: hypothetical protein A2505_09580 [Deltaproteobacteria bacterium RIFOXYD12_FULL_55_16]
MSRGIVITPRFEFDGQRFSMGGGFDPVSLRQYLLYWDKLDWPNNNIIAIGDAPELEFLRSAGVLERTMVRFTSFAGNVGYAMLQMQVSALEERDKNEPGTWSLAQHSKLLASSPEGTVETRSLEVEIYSAVPVPAADVSFEEILEFKQRRNSELLHFRSAMDELYQEAASAADIPRAKLQAQDRIQRALQDLNDVFGESFARRFLSSLKVELNIPNIAGLALAGGAAAASFGMPIAVAAGAGAIAGALKFDMAHIRKGANIPASLRAYAYLHHIEQELR